MKNILLKKVILNVLMYNSREHMRQQTVGFWTLVKHWYILALSDLLAVNFLKLNMN